MTTELKKLSYKKTFVKKRIILCMLGVFSFIPFFGQNTDLGIKGESNWMRNWTNFKPHDTRYRESTHELYGEIKTNTTLHKENTYILQGQVYVTNKAVLTIEPGTVIKGGIKSGGALIITQGAQLMAEGKETDPIVFTSDAGEKERRPGDWGGIIILGEAPINTIGNAAKLDFNLENERNRYGGTNPESNSGILKYVRIEFAGKNYSANKQLNGLSLAGVGSKTVLENIQVSFSNDDSFNCYGGLVNMSNLISYKATDDDFDFAQGVHCNISNSIAIRSPYSSNSNGSTCFEIDSYQKNDTSIDFSKKITTVNATNMTFINLESNDQGLVQEAISIKENAALNLKNTIISGFKCPIYLNENLTANLKNLENITFTNIKMNNCRLGIEVETKTYEVETAVDHWFNFDKNKISYVSIPMTEMFMQPNIKEEVDFRTSKNMVKFVSN